MKKSNRAVTSPTGRIAAYLSVFIVASALHELLDYLINPARGSVALLVLTLSTLGVFVLVGALLICERHLLSRVVSAGTLLILGFVSLRVGHSFIPDPYLLVVALSVAVIGAQALWHRKGASLPRTIVYSLLAGSISLILSFTFLIGMSIIERTIAWQYFESRGE